MTSALPNMNLSKLDGLRGIAAIIVVFSHSLFWFYPAMHLGERTKGRSLDGIEWFESPFTFFYRGGFSVSMFFILSGLVLTYSVSRNPDALLSIRKAVMKRYIRLGVPVGASVIIGCLLMKFGAFQAPDITPVPVLSSTYLFEATWPTALRDALFGALALGDSRYNYVLWTIQIELIGSFAIFSGFALFGSNALIYRAFCLLAFLLLSISTQKTAMYCSLFFLGSMLVTFRFNDEPKYSLIQAPRAILVLVSGLYLAGYHPASHAYTWINELSRNLSAITGYRPAWIVIIPALGGLLILLSVLSTPRLFKPLDSAPIRLLGKLSFSIYLLHTFILVMAGQFFTRHLGMGLSAMLMTLTTTLTVTVVVSYFFHLKVDVPAIALSNRFAGWTLRASAGTGERKNQVEQTTA